MLRKTSPGLRSLVLNSIASTGAFPAYRWRTNESWDTIPYSNHPYAYALSNPVFYVDPTGRSAALPDGGGGGYDPYCQDGSRRPANGQCQYEFVADAQAGLGGGAGSAPPDPEEYWNRLIQTKPVTLDPSGVFDEDKGQPGQVIFVPTDLGPGIVIQRPPSLQELSNQEIFTCPDEWLFPNYVTSRKSGAGSSKPLKSTYKYGDLDKYGRATGAEAVLVAPITKGAKSRADVPGLNTDYHDRTHLIPKELGGSGQRENIVPMYYNVNQQVMVQFEQQVVAAVNAGDVVRYKATPHYQGSDPIPIAVTIKAKGKTVNIYVTVLNRPDPEKPRRPK